MGGPELTIAAIEPQDLQHNLCLKRFFKFARHRSKRNKGGVPINPCCTNHKASRKTVRRVCQAVYAAQGGCAFVLASEVDFKKLEEEKGVYYPPVDEDDRYPDGYMTQRLRNATVESDAFRKAIVEFTSRGEHDRWLAHEEASGLPKDGFFLVDWTGRLYKCAVRIEGLPSTPLMWKKVGCRHMTAMQMCYASRDANGIVIVRSDTGDVHGLHSCNGIVKALKVKREALSQWCNEVGRFQGGSRKARAR